MRLLPRGWSSTPEKHLKEIMARGKKLGTEHKQLRHTLILTEDGNHSQMLGPALAGLLLLLGAGLGSPLPPTPQGSQEQLWSLQLCPPFRAPQTHARQTH